MRLTKQERRDAKELLRACLVEGQLDEGRVRQTVQELIARKPRGYFGILSHFHRLVRLAVQRRTARVESAIALAVPQREALTGNLTRLYGPGLQFEFQANPALLGGLRIQVGSDVFDGSVQSRLARLAESF